MLSNPLRAKYMASSETPVHPAPSFSSGVHAVDYAGRVIAGSEGLMPQAFPQFRNSSLVPDTAHKAALQHAGYVRQGYGLVPSTEMLTNTQPPPLATSGYMSYPQGAYVQDNQAFAMTHQYGAGFLPPPQYATPGFQSEYHNTELVASVPGNQPSLYTFPYAGTQDGVLESQRVSEVGSQNAWSHQQQPVDSQQQQFQQWQLQYQSFAQYNAAAVAALTKKTQKFPFLKKRPKFPPATGPMSPGWCAVCGIDLNSASVLQTHITGRKHKRKMQLTSQEGKNLIDKTGTIKMSILTHEADKNGTEMQEPSLNNAQTTKDGESSVGSRKFTDVNVDGTSLEPSLKRPNLFLEMGIIKEPCPAPKLPLLNEKCEICNVACNSKSVLEAHFRGRKHAAKVQQLKEGTLGNNLNSALLRNIHGGT